MSFAGIALTPFAAPDGPSTSLQVDCRRRRGRVTLVWRLVAALPLAWPARVAPPARRDRLWEHTCFEAFFAPVGGSAYWELNLSPAGDWQCYRFAGYRDGMAVEEAIAAPAFEASSDGRGLSATFDLAPVPALAVGALDAGLTAVLEAADGSRTHWALRHTAPQPDFHRRDAFALRLPAEDDA